MGKIVVINSPICYLVGVDGRNIYAIPRGVVETELKRTNYDTHPVYPIQDQNIFNYFNIGPWSEYFNISSNYSEKEEVLRKIIINKMFVDAAFEISKREFENSIVNKGLSVGKLVNFLEAYEWVSKIVTVECYEVGNEYDYNFNIYQRSALNFMGKKGDLSFTFRWSELNCLRILNYSGFEIDTKSGLYSGWLNKGGFPTKEQFSQKTKLIKHSENY